MPRRTRQTPASATNETALPTDTRPGAEARKSSPAAQAQETRTKPLVPSRPVNGGQLRSGYPGGPGNPHPLGPPTALIRGELRGTYAERKVFLDEVVRGDLLTQTAVPMSEVIQHVRCGTCGNAVIQSDSEAVLWEIVIPGRTVASVKDRLAALDQMARYGVGTLKEVSVDNVRERVSQTLAAIRLHCPPEQAEVLYRALEPIWK